MAEPNLASSTTSTQQKGQNAIKVKIQYWTFSACDSNQWQTENMGSTHLCFVMAAN